MLKIFNITVDPGMGNVRRGGATGIAVWEEETWAHLTRPEECAILSSRYDDWVDRAFHISGQFAEFANKYSKNGAGKVFIEWPKNFQTAVGQAATNSDKIHKLVFIIGCIAQYARVYGYQVELVPVEYKGQLSKLIVERRVHRILKQPIGTYKSHVCDSVYMGLFLKGIVK